MRFEDKMIELRRKKGWSQEQLAGYMDVTRQAVGKWEAGRAMPDVPKLIMLADLFGVSVDELVRGGAGVTAEAPIVTGPLVPVGQLAYEYKSKTTLFGLPLVHICWGRWSGRPKVAKGIVAIGDAAIGVFALGGFAAGVVSLGGVSLGLLLALGGVAFGGVAIGGMAVGAFAFGGFALGIWALGGGALGLEAAGGGWAHAKLVVDGKGVFTNAGQRAVESFEQFRDMAREATRWTPEWFLQLLYFLR